MKDILGVKILYIIAVPLCIAAIIFGIYFMSKIEERWDKLKEGKIADMEALKEAKQMELHLLSKEDDKIPDLIQKKAGSDIFYRNLKDIFLKYEIGENLVIDIILDIFNILNAETIVDWHKNNEVKRVITNKVDDYLYDVVKIKKGIDLSNEDIQKLMSTVLDLALNNNEIFSHE